MPPKVLNPGKAASCVKGTFDVIERLIRIWICKNVILRIFSMTRPSQDLAHFRVQNVDWDLAILSAFGASCNDHVSREIDLAPSQCQLLTFP